MTDDDFEENCARLPAAQEVSNMLEHDDPQLSVTANNARAELM